MDLQIRRIVLFTPNIDRLRAFYETVIGLKVVGAEPGWVDFNAGPVRLALHEGGGQPGKRPPKIAFYAQDVAAARAALVKKGAKMGKLISTPHFDMCDGKDPDGNPFGVSARA